MQIFSSYIFEGDNTLMKKSFQQWCIEENKEYLLEEWYMPINQIKPDCISYGTNKKYWWKYN